MVTKSPEPEKPSKQRNRTSSKESISSDELPISRNLTHEEKKIEEKAKIQINLLNRLSKKKVEEKSPSPPPQGFKIRHAPKPVVVPTCLQVEEDEESESLKKLKKLSAMINTKELIAQRGNIVIVFLFTTFF